ncbi:S8 family peptidase [Cytobacillus firmus]|nr:S8 family peptidase [Cytobacillus firmus]
MENLPMIRVELELDRRKRPGFGQAPQRDFRHHGNNIQENINQVIRNYHRPKPKGIKPELILKISYENKIPADELRRCGFEVIGEKSGKALILFSTDEELTDFQSRLVQYQAGPQNQSDNPSYNGVFANINQVSVLTPEDRMGSKLRAITIEAESSYWIDIELWHLGAIAVCREKIKEMRDYINENEGKVTDDYLGSSVCVLRANVTGKLLNELLELDMVRTVDLPPQPTFLPRDYSSVSIESLQEVQPPSPDSPSICIIDSGVMQGHPLLGPALGDSACFPTELGDTSDVEGHGTKVAGLALYGDVLNSIRLGIFKPEHRIFSARVTNSDNKFDDEKLITTQMRDAIRYFHDEYACKIFNISLGDDENIYVDGKQTLWASVLDELIRELDIVVLISAGNYFYYPDEPENILSEYPDFLFDESAKIIDPASAALALTVGSYCSNFVAPAMSGMVIERGVYTRIIGGENFPSPFTRTGPGVGGAVKPELCEYGGNLLFDGLTRRIKDDRSTSVLSTSKNIPDEMFTTDIGTSYASPQLAYKAAQLYKVFPDASSSLIRALLVHSALLPNNIEMTSDKILRSYGYGISNVDRVTTSSNNRVTLYTEGTLEYDKFHVYEIPIPEDFNSVSGDRHISVTLAFNPPTRHTRLDYLGVTMSFRLIRGKDLEEVVEFFRARKKEEGAPDKLGSHDCLMYPTPSIRDNGTVQKAVFTAKRKLDYGSTYYLVVRCESVWATEELGPQDYSIVATLEHTNENVDLYTEIFNRVEETIRENVRVKKVRVRV